MKRMRVVLLAAVAGLWGCDIEDPDAAGVAEFFTAPLLDGDSNLPNDPHFPSQWALDKIEATKAWAHNTGNRRLVVAVIDTGVDYTHPDLAANIWRNFHEIAGNGIDDDGNGYVDDVRGWDFGDGDSDPMDGQPVTHGTFLAGIIGAVGNNGTGIAGLNWSVKIMPLKFLGSDGNAWVVDAAAAIRYAVANRAHVINLSWGAPDSELLRDAVAEAVSAGLVVVAAAGNTGSSAPIFPASYDGVVAVSATNLNDAVPPLSNHGSYIDVAAPGAQILTTAWGHGYAQVPFGTSLSCAHVSGLAALIRSWRPLLPRAQIVQAICASADDLGDGGWDPYYGHGRINARRALGLFGGF